MIVRNAYARDFEDVYRLMLQFDDPPPRDAWRGIFAGLWPSEEDYCGKLLIDGKRVVGFIGFLFSRRTIHGRTLPFCNLSSWIIERDCRGQGLSYQLLEEFVKIAEAGYTVTAFTPTAQSQAMLVKGGFDVLDRKFRVVLPIPTVGRARVAMSIDTDVNSIKRRLGDVDARLLTDHLAFGCRYILLESPRGNSFVVVSRIIRKGIPLGRILYIGNPDLLLPHLEELVSRICLRLRVVALLISERHLRGHEIRGSLVRDRIEQFRSTELQPPDIDALYSEMPVLFGH